MEICDVIQGIRETQHKSVEKCTESETKTTESVKKITESVKRLHILDKIPGFQVSISGLCTLMSLSR